MEHMDSFNRSRSPSPSQTGSVRSGSPSGSCRSRSGSRSSGYNHYDAISDAYDRDMALVKTPDVSVSVSTLFDLAARMTAKHISCEELEQHQPPLDDNMLKRIAYWSCPQYVSAVKAFADLTLRGANDWNYDAKRNVEKMIQVGFMVMAVVDGSANVSFTLEKQLITSSTCEKCHTTLLCCHLRAAIVYRMEHASEIPIHAPVTETLSALSRAQIQKLIQYTINEDPERLLRKVFMIMDQVQDSTSELNKTQGAPDPTFGLAHGKRTLWEMAIEEINISFKGACNKGFDHHEFPDRYIFSEPMIKFSSLYKQYLQRVVDLVLTDQIETAGRVLIALATIATNVALSRSGTPLESYTHFLKSIEKMCSLYILQFEVEARKDLILLCQNLNKNLKLVCRHSNWAELPTVSSLYPRDSLDVPGVLGAKQTSMFYEPLCVSMVPVPTQEYYDLVTGAAEPADSTYNEPLPLMMLRFEAIRLWKKSEDGEKELSRLGAVILRKLIQMTFQFSVLKEKDRVTKIKQTNKANKKKRKVVEESDDISSKRSPTKKAKISRLRKTKLPTQEPTSNFPSSNIVKVENTNTMDEKPDTLLSFEDLMESVEPNTQEEMEDMCSPDYLYWMLDSLDRGNNLTEGLHKETLSYCLMHTCSCIYQLQAFDSMQDRTDNEFLALATLMALEFSRIRTTAENGSSISLAEHIAWYRLENRLVTFYKDKNGMTDKEFSSGLHSLYMKLLCECNVGRVCFFDCGIPLLLISFLVKHSLTDAAPDNKHQARCLCVYTLCHSYKPVHCYYFQNSGVSDDAYKQPLKCFADIITTFLLHIKNYPERKSWLIKLLGHYEKVQDNSLYILLREVREFPYGTESNEVQIALVRFLFNCIKVQNKRAASFIISESKAHQSDVHHIMTNLCNKLETQFTELVIENWKDVVKFFKSSQLYSILNTIKEFCTQGMTFSAVMVQTILEFFSGTFQHDVEGCQLITFFKPGDEKLDQAISIIRENMDSFTPEAMLYVAREYLEHQLSVPGKISSGEIFCSDVESFTKCALKRVAVEDKPCHSCPGSYTGDILPQNSPNSQIQLLLKAFTKKPVEVVAKCRQFTDILGMVLEVFSDDLPTILSICSSVEKQKCLRDKYSSIFGKRIIKLVNKFVFEKLTILKPKYYIDFGKKLAAIEDYIIKYVADGPEAFKTLMRKIKRHHKTKRKLMDDLNDLFNL